MNRKLFGILTVMVLLLVVAPVGAEGATQVSGSGYFAAEGECTDPVTGPEGQGPDVALKLSEDLEGCLYLFVET